MSTKWLDRGMGIDAIVDEVVGEILDDFPDCVVSDGIIAGYVDSISYLGDSDFDTACTMVAMELEMNEFEVIGDDEFTSRFASKKSANLELARVGFVSLVKLYPYGYSVLIDQNFDHYIDAANDEAAIKMFLSEYPQAVVHPKPFDYWKRYEERFASKKTAGFEWVEADGLIDPKEMWEFEDAYIDEAYVCDADGNLFSIVQHSVSEGGNVWAWDIYVSDWRGLDCGLCNTKEEAMAICEKFMQRRLDFHNQSFANKAPEKTAQEEAYCILTNVDLGTNEPTGEYDSYGNPLFIDRYDDFDVAMRRFDYLCDYARDAVMGTKDVDFVIVTWYEGSEPNDSKIIDQYSLSSDWRFGSRRTAWTQPKVLPRDSEEYKIMQRLCDRLNSAGSNYTFTIEDVYFDFGQDWMWTTIVADDGSEWGGHQVLNPRQFEYLCESGNIEYVFEEIAHSRWIDYGFKRASKKNAFTLDDMDYLTNGVTQEWDKVLQDGKWLSITRTDAMGAGWFLYPSDDAYMYDDVSHDLIDNDSPDVALEHFFNKYPQYRTASKRCAFALDDMECRRDGDGYTLYQMNGLDYNGSQCLFWIENDARRYNDGRPCWSWGFGEDGDWGESIDGGWDYLPTPEDALDEFLDKYPQYRTASKKSATRTFTYAEQKELEDEVIDKPWLNNADRLKDPDILLSF